MKHLVNCSNFITGYAQQARDKKLTSQRVNEFMRFCSPSILRNDPAAEDRCAMLPFPLNSLNLLNHSTVLVSHFLSPIAYVSRPSGIAHSL